MIPKIIHQTWKTAEVPLKWVPFQQKVQQLNEGWQYRLWTDADNEEFVRREFPEFFEQFVGYPKGIMRADVIRYLIMYRLGGVYLDLDYEVLRPFDFGESHMVLPMNRSIAEGDKQDEVGNCIFASEPGHPFWRDVITELLERPPVVVNYSNVIDATGPGLLTRVYKKGHYMDVTLPPRLWYHPPTPTNAKAAERIRQNGVSLGIHHPWGSWKERWTWTYLVQKFRKI